MNHLDEQHIHILQGIYKSSCGGLKRVLIGEDGGIYIANTKERLDCVHCLEFLQEQGYIAGIEKPIQRMNGDKVYILNIEITREGIEFVKNLENQQDIIQNENTKSYRISPKIKSVLSKIIIGVVVGIVATVVGGLILHFLTR
ncbi:hypothetical protein [Helicobacter macacae]|uniref:Uncharacterized protein n=1 Tax=Helicobacter macacae MIT 99-5501 TaxID=1357400 RepID=V8CDJ7_9HELI|nr:hypothetical protein [Helicobacter macacae]ETD25182.1 hypothetical protein HMPREF2086_00517 [Helicobacter macacae MIT 99-5501]